MASVNKMKNCVKATLASKSTVFHSKTIHLKLNVFVYFKLINKLLCCSHTLFVFLKFRFKHLKNCESRFMRVLVIWSRFDDKLFQDLN